MEMVWLTVSMIPAPRGSRYGVVNIIRFGYVVAFRYLENKRTVWISTELGQRKGPNLLSRIHTSAFTVGQFGKLTYFFCLDFF